MLIETKVNKKVLPKSQYTFSAEEFNQIVQEIQNVITEAGLTLSENSVDQLKQSFNAKANKIIAPMTLANIPLGYNLRGKTLVFDTEFDVVDYFNNGGLTGSITFNNTTGNYGGLALQSFIFNETIYFVFKHIISMPPSFTPEETLARSDTGWNGTSFTFPDDQDYIVTTQVMNKNFGQHISEQDATVVIDLSDVQKNKVDKETGKGLSTNDYTTADKNKLAGIAAGAEVIIIPDAEINLSVLANKHYVLDNTALTKITLTGCEASRLETTIEFSTGANIPELNVSTSGINWKEELALKVNKSYLIVIFNKWAFVEER